MRTERRRFWSSWPKKTIRTRFVQERRIISWKGLYIGPRKIYLFYKYLNVRNSQFKTPPHRDNTLDDSHVFTYRMVRITGDAPSHCFALLHSRFGWNSRESSQPLSTRRNAQPLGRAFTLSRDDLAFANVESRSQISFADNKCDLISISRFMRHKLVKLQAKADSSRFWTIAMI